MIRKAKICDAKLVFIVSAFDKLLSDEHFVTLLRAESLFSMPKYLWTKLGAKHKGVAAERSGCRIEMRRYVFTAVILPVRQVKDPQKNIRRYQTIRASIKEVGLVEPLVVHPQKDTAGTYLLLDGHLRYFVPARILGETGGGTRIIATPTTKATLYRAHQLCWPHPVEHKMIVKAGSSGTGETGALIAATLNIPVRNLLKVNVKLLTVFAAGVAVDLLADCSISPSIGLLKQVTCVFTDLIAELMVVSNNYTAGCVRRWPSTKRSVGTARWRNRLPKRGYQPKKLARWSGDEF